MALCYASDFVKLAHDAIPLMLDQRTREQAQEAERLARDALCSSPFDEELHRLLLRSLAGQGRYADAASEYEQIRDMLLMELGVDPDGKTQELYRELQNIVAAPRLTASELVGRLREEGSSSGPLVCDFARFKLHYQAEARSAARRGDSVHLGLFTITSKSERGSSERGLANAMVQLLDHMRLGLRAGDIVAQCSASQVVLMLLQANYEDSSLVCRRITESFRRDHRRLPVQVSVVVVPLEPVQGARSHAQGPTTRNAWNGA